MCLHKEREVMNEAGKNGNEKRKIVREIQEYGTWKSLGRKPEEKRKETKKGRKRQQFKRIE